MLYRVVRSQTLDLGADAIEYLYVAMQHTVLGRIGKSILVLYRPYELVTDVGSQGKLVSERSRPGSARSAFQAAQAASTTAS